MKIDKDLAQDLKKLAEKDHITKTQLIKNAVVEYQKAQPQDLDQLLQGQLEIIALLQEIKAAPMLQLGIVQQQAPTLTPTPAASSKRNIWQRLKFWRK